MKAIKNIILKGSDSLPMLTDIFFTDQLLARPVIIYSHGFNGFKDWGNFDLIAERFADAGYVFIKFNFSHNGTGVNNPEEFVDLEGFGNNNYSKQLADLNSVVNWLFDEKNDFKDLFNLQNVSLIGHSLGGGISIIHASEDKRIKQLITWASISECKTPWGSWNEERLSKWKETGVEYYLNSRTNQHLPLYYQLYEDFQENHFRLDIIKSISSLIIPILICHGTLDPSVPVEKAYQLKDAQPSAEIFLLETDHVFGRKHPWEKNELPEQMEKVVEVSIEFLNRHL